MELEALTIPGMVHTMNHKCLCPSESRPSALDTLVKSRTNSMARVCMRKYESTVRKLSAGIEYRGTFFFSFLFLRRRRWIFDTGISQQRQT